MKRVDVDDLLELMQGRRSIRRYRPDPIPAELEDKLLKALVWAPSAGNSQPWHFVRVRDPQLRQQLGQAAYAQSFIAEAPLVVVACVDEARAYQAYSKQGVLLYSLQDIGAALQNLLLAAHAMHLGACWIGAFQEETVAKTLALAPELRPVAVVPIGYPAERPPTPRRRSVQELTSRR